MFYAVYTYSNLEEGAKFDDFIFEDVTTAIETLKKHPGSRMKLFAEKDEAIKFLEQCHSKPDEQQKPVVDSTLSPSLEAKLFPSPLPRELSALRFAIQKGNIDDVEKLIWANPLLLATVCDTPTILMAGPKYNACHIAAKAGQAEALKLILDTVANFSFIRKLYPKDPEDFVQYRQVHLIDAYLNTADPKTGATPLIHACRLLHYDAIKVLLNFRQIDLNSRDAYNLTARETLSKLQDPSEPENADIDAKVKKIEGLFESNYYIPIYKDYESDFVRLMRPCLDPPNFLSDDLNSSLTNTSMQQSFNENSFATDGFNSSINGSMISLSICEQSIHCDQLTAVIGPFDKDRAINLYKKLKAMLRQQAKESMSQVDELSLNFNKLNIQNDDQMEKIRNFCESSGDVNVGIDFISYSYSPKRLYTFV